MPNNIINKFTSYLKKAINQALDFAQEMNQPEVSLAYIFFGLLNQKGSLGSEILIKLGLSPDSVRSELIRWRVKDDSDFDSKKKKTAKPNLSQPAKSALEKAVIMAKQNKHMYIGTEHLLQSIINLNDSEINKILEKNKIKVADIKRHLSLILRSTSKFPDLTKLFSKANDDLGESMPTPGMPTKLKGAALDLFAINLTDPVIQKNIDPVIGRQVEISRLISILSRRTKNNPVLLGDAGVGKTAIVEGLAKRILLGEVPEILANKKIYNLDLSLVVAGTIYRGEFESRVKQLIDEIKADSNIIVFIDEVHTIIGTGSTQGSMDAANILKPALAKGQIRLIGATTPEEFKKHIESDAALERRFQPIIVEEPSPEATEEVLKGIRSNYENYHRVSITDEAIEAAVRLSTRYIQDKFLPDKAIDLIDEAASKIKIKNKSDGLTKKIKQFEAELANIQKRKRQAVNQEKFQQAVALKYQEKMIIDKTVRLKQKQMMSSQKKVGKITGQEIAEVVANITNIPLNELVVEEKQRLLKLETELAREIVGQSEAIKAIAASIRRSRAGISQPNRPLGSFIFLGPSGVGKTELAKVLASAVFEDPKALIRIDMSEFGEGFNISKLIGAPAGYIGYKDTNKLTDQVKKRPYSVVLFDEIEKANSEVFNLLLQVLEDGQLTDAVGKTINFKNTIIIMTSNIGLDSLNKGAALGFAASTDKKTKQAGLKYEEIKETVLKELKKKFKPEFINRVDKIIVFKPLDLKSVKKIVIMQIKELQERLKNKSIQIKLDKSAINYIADKGWQPEQGARAIRKIIQEEIEDPLAEQLLAGQFVDDDVVNIKLVNKKLVLKK